jgi:thiosulfate dehydrogenase [quinone] large subunit
MKENKPFSNLQLTTLVILRMIVGWHLLYEGFAKLLNPGWSSTGFLRESQWVMSGLADWITSNSGVLGVVDFLNTWGLIAIGLALMLGLFSRIAAIFGAALLFIYYLNSPPLTGLEYTLPTEGNNLIVNKTLIEAVTLFLLALFPTSQFVGLDLFIRRTGKKNP